MEDHPKSVVRSAFHFLSGTFLSRVTGLFREVAMAFCFGASPAIAAFLVGYRFSNLMRRLFGEGSLLAGFSPHFETARKESPEKAALFFRDLFSSLSFFLILLITLIEVGLFSWWKWADTSADTQEILVLTMLMLPGILFICLYALFSALLQCEKKYFLPGIAPMMFNLVTLGAIWWVKDWPSQTAMIGLSVSVVVAFFSQWMMVIPSTLKFLKPQLSWSSWLQAKFFSPELRHMIGGMALTIMGVGAVQINAALDTVFARFASLSGPAYLNYAMRLYQLPLALFGVALASALLPPLSRSIQSGAIENYHRLLHFSLSRSFSLMMPCTIGILALGASAVNLIYGHGGFDQEATINTVSCLWAYGLGLIPAVFVLLLAPAFYAKKDYRTPLYASLISVGLNVALNMFLVFVLNWGASSIAFATAFSAAYNFYYLSNRLAKKIGPLFDRETLWSFIKTSGAALIAGTMTIAIGFFLLNDPTLKIVFSEPAVFFPRDITDQFLQFITLGGSFILIFLSYAWMFNAQEVLQLIGLKKEQ